MTLTLCALALAGAATAAYFAVAIRRIMLSLRVTPRLAAYAARPVVSEPPTVCVVVPAHNEERVIGRAVRSILAQDHPSLCVVFALDRCTDGTRAILDRAAAGDERVEIVEIDSCPDDWAGKTHALGQGVARSSAARAADLLLFLDADTEMAPSCVRSAVALLTESDSDLVSLLGRLSRDRWYERIVQPMTSLELMRQNPLFRVNRAHSRTSFANGQFLLFRRSAYQAIGGHARVKDDLLEDLAFARALKQDERPWVVALAGTMLRVRMYGSWDAFHRGWKRIFIESAYRRPERLRVYARLVRIAYTLLPTLSLMALVSGAIAVTDGGGVAAVAALGAGGVGLGAWLVAMTMALAAQGASVASLIASPVGAWLTGGILAEAAVDLELNRPLPWGGRVYTDLAPPTPARFASRGPADTLPGSCESSSPTTTASAPPGSRPSTTP